MKPDLNQYKAFIFDLDGTLIDSEKYHADGFSQAVEALTGYQITDEERREFFESHTNTFAPILAKRHGLTFDVAEVLRRKRRHVEKHFRTDVFPQAIHFIRKWRARKRLALASNSPKSFVRNALVEGRMIDLFETVCTADDVEHRKPDPEMYLLTLEWLKLAPEETIVFEDSPAGVHAAQAAGCPVVMMENGSGRTVDGVEKFTWRELS
ncbi:HAD family hydrolase [Tichowtungia aerotolerans]|uniref:phosphoglycolate phosphatase n=1 Tax=Tichowtungia aerotolerans TaxID=2697043 RepID=A0A6P1MAW8_9BACT|nr:HAD family phosphatase [Tichowtungia aerotolerans]QHI69694.1 HAD-IA family hydrolase [Tichowtungia aerotolerans]